MNLNWNPLFVLKWRQTPTCLESKNFSENESKKQQSSKGSARLKARTALPTDGSANVGSWTCLSDKTKHSGPVLNPGTKRRTDLGYCTYRWTAIIVSQYDRYGDWRQNEHHAWPNERWIKYVVIRRSLRSKTPSYVGTTSVRPAPFVCDLAKGSY